MPKVILTRQFVYWHDGYRREVYGTGPAELPDDAFEQASQIEGLIFKDLPPADNPGSDTPPPPEEPPADNPGSDTPPPSEEPPADNPGGDTPPPSEEPPADNPGGDTPPSPEEPPADKNKRTKAQKDPK